MQFGTVSLSVSVRRVVRNRNEQERLVTSLFPSRRHFPDWAIQTPELGHSEIWYPTLKTKAMYRSKC
jgi:hypothetical protein